VFLIEGLKKRLIAAAMDRQKAANPFDIEYSDRYRLPPGADELHNNSQYFSVHDIQGRRTLYMRLALRGGNAPDEVWLVYREADGPVYIAGKDHIPKGEPLPASIKCVQAGKELQFEYRGHVKQGKFTERGYVPDPDSRDIPVELDARFYGLAEAFEFSRHMSTEPVARALARERFTREFRAALTENHQVHFEQSGVVTGTLKLAGREIIFDKVSAFRDHSYGRRDWNYMDRHNWFIGLLENGDTIQTNMVRYPAVRELQTGFYQSQAGGFSGAASRGKLVCLKKQSSMDELPLTGGIPESFSYTAEFEDGRQFKVECTLDFTIPFSFGGGTFIIHEGVSSFNVNGIKGRGITEFGFNTDSSRWKR
jgi:hypothetical protein